MQQIQDKVRELEHLLKIKDMSSQMASYFDELALSVEGLAGGAQGMFTWPTLYPLHQALCYVQLELTKPLHSQLSRMF